MVTSFTIQRSDPFTFSRKAGSRVFFIRPYKLPLFGAVLILVLLS